ncbi:hypothetical protein DFH07DRAFT_768672 [Mycena maculata]|uniref:Uncharacterized protein n=1 Tax=Mycena maculata TaxID=230809 RepID=A0AAD7NQK7_9AGAR|nr:hypothetical protein DFH07DRAFT_768672 [Mycena maculata]
MTLFLVKPGIFYFFIGLIPSGKLYMNSMLATLNTRDHIRNKGREAVSGGWNSMQLEIISGGPPAAQLDNPHYLNGGVGVTFDSVHFGFFFIHFPLFYPPSPTTRECTWQAYMVF